MPPVRHRRFRALAVGTGLMAAMTAPVVLPTSATAASSSVIDGPDVSSYQHGSTAPNWTKVANDGKEFAIVKATEGTTYTNPYFSSDYSGVRKAGLVRGSYHFARPATPILRTARAQAKHYAAALGSSTTMTRTLPPVLDIEVTGGLGPSALTAWTQAFLLKTERLTHRRPMIYTYPSFWSYSIADTAALSRFPLWMASYGSSSAPSGSTLWQYTSTGSVAGIAGDVDLSRFTGAATAWTAMSDGTGGDDWPAAVPGVPQQVSASISNGSIAVRWMPGDSGSTDIAHYRVTATSPAGVVSKRVGPLSFGATLSGLAAGQQYAVTVRAINAVGIGPASAPITLATSLIPTTLKARGPSAPVVFGHPATTTVRLTRSDTGAALAGKTITVQRRRTGTSTWHDFSQVTTGSDGTAAVTLALPRRDVDVQVSFAGTGYRASSATTSVQVRSAISAVLSATSVPVGRSVTLTGAVAPSRASVAVRRQILTSSGWVTVQRTKTFEDGTYQFTWTPHVAHTTKMRTQVAPTGGREAGFSPTLTFTAK